MPQVTERDRLERLLGGTELAALRARLRRRLAANGPAQALVLTRLLPHERRALEGLLGLRTRSAGSLRVSLSELDAVLTGAGLATSLRHALEQLDGPIPDLAAERHARDETWRAVFSSVTAPGLLRLLTDNATLGLVKRLARGRPEHAQVLLANVERVLAHLPASGIPRSQLATYALEDAHALDAGNPTATLVIAALRCNSADALHDEEPLDHEAQPEETEREVWASVGVLVNELAAPALLLNVPAAADSTLGVILERAREHGLPLHLSLHNLLRAAPRWQVQDRDLFVCENPNLVAIAADRLGAACAPLVCTDGMPSASQRTLLSQLAAHGARLHYHGDFDWPGIRIANFVLRSHGARPWRMGSGDYIGKRGRALAGVPVQASWDLGLCAAMEAGGYALEEEAVATLLCEDLRLAAG
jgi:uncharacterized protein (TIGR02679 family)